MSLSSSCLPVAPPVPSQQIQTGGIAMPALMLAAIYAVPIVVALRPVADPVIDPDIWWHLRVGQWVSEHHAVPVTDPFSRYGVDKPWVAYSWLYEVLVYRLYEMFGLAGIVVYRVAMSLAVVAALHRLVRRREPNFLAATGLTAVAALAMAPLYSERPWLFTLLFTTLTLDVLLDLRQGKAPRGMWLLPIIYALWANLHIQFVYGLFLLGLACLAPWIDAQLAQGVGCADEGGSPGAWWASKTRPTLLLTGLCLAATLINPYHVQVYGVVVEYATQSGPFRCVNELRALEFRETPDWVVLLLGAAAVFALGRRRQLSSFEVLLLMSAGVFAFRSRRDLWFLVLAAAAILASGVALAPRALPLGALTRPRSPDRRCWVVAATLLAVLIGVFAWQRNLTEENLRRKVAGVFPVEAVAVIAERGYVGPLFNDFNWGGFLIWSLPQLPVVLDGRTNLHGDERMLRIGNTWAAGPGWRNDPDLASAEVVLADAQSPLGCVLMLDDRFVLVYEDAIARVFLRKRPRESVSDHREPTGTP